MKDLNQERRDYWCWWGKMKRPNCKVCYRQAIWIPSDGNLEDCYCDEHWTHNPEEDKEEDQSQ
jgi:hypothetical protein